MVGLGNPGPQYTTTRHNAGFMLADVLAERWEMGRFRRAPLGDVVRGPACGRDVAIVKPSTFMNRSGRAVRALVDETGIDPTTQLLVLVDEVALPVGSLRIRPEGSAGGHNGLRSIEAALGHRLYARLRIGVGPGPEGEDLADFVLGQFEKGELEVIADLMPTLVEAVECWLTDGVETAMNRYNRRTAP